MTETTSELEVPPGLVAALLERCGRAPRDAEAWRNLGLALLASAEPLRALSALGRAHRLAPADLDYALGRAEVAHRAGVAQAELMRLGEDAESDPLNPAPLAARGMLLHLIGRNVEAIDALDAACVLEPRNSRLWAILGGVLARAYRLDAAEAALARAAQLDPENFALLQDRGAVLLLMSRFAEARQVLESVRDARGEDATLLANLASATLYLGQQDAALALARRAHAIAPSYLTHISIANALPYAPGTSAAALLAAQRECAASLPRPSAPREFRNAADPDRPIRVGLLSGLLKTHPVAWLTLAGFEALDPADFTLVGLADTMPGDAMSRRFRAAAREWQSVARLDDAALADAARALEIDILIDLGGYGDVGRMTACAHRLAPVQVKWVGMQNHSTGMAEMDWFITDRWETPPELASLYSERLLVLPDGYVCYSAPPDAPDVAPLPALANGFPTFGCFTNLAKVTTEVIETWAEIMRRSRNARFVLKSPPLVDPETTSRVRDAFSACGISPNRVDLRGQSPHRTFLGQYGEIDIALDTFPYCGGLTTVEALWMGVPTVTVPGDFFAARHSLSHLSNVGLADWVAPDLAGYIDLAVRRASEPQTLSELRGELRARAKRSPLCDAPRFGRNLGAALRHAWRDWCAAR